MDFVLEYLDLTDLITRMVTFGPRLVVALLVMLGFWLLFRITRRPLRVTLVHTGVHAKLVDLLIDNVYRYALMVFGLVMALSQLGIDVGAAVAGLGVAGLAVGLAAQDTLANTIAGLTIFWDKPFVVGDWVTVAGEYGMAQDITLRSTRIRTPRNTYVVIPNKRVIDEVLENDSKHGEMRIDVPIGIAYKEDTHAAREALLKAVAGVPGVLRDPAPSVVVEACADSSVNLLLRVWLAEAGDRQASHFAVMEVAKRALDAAGIQIPFPHLQLFWDDVEERVIDRLQPLTGGRGAA